MLLQNPIVCFVEYMYVLIYYLYIDTIHKTWIFLLINIAIKPNDSFHKSFQNIPI